MMDTMENKQMRGRCLYTPKGAAREYAAVGCNFYRGCPHGCAYCYNRRGITSGTLGGDRPVLMDKFTGMKNRPKSYACLKPEDYAFHCFRQEMAKDLGYLRKAGIFLSFTTDPMCEECFTLTWRAADYATACGVPVRILTKSAEYSFVRKALMLALPHERRHLVSVGFTLTGRDDMEPHAGRNAERIESMRWFHGNGFRTFASIEPVVDFDSSLAMIREATECCSLFLIGLMSGVRKGILRQTGMSEVRKGYYDRQECARFVLQTYALLESSPLRPKVYWKESVRRLMKDDALTMSRIMYADNSLNREDYIWDN